MSDTIKGLTAVTSVLAVVGGLIFLLMWGLPQYGIYRQSLAGQAEMARADQNRQVQVREAQARLDAASLLAQAEVVRAQGVHDANEIIAAGLGGPEGYLRYLFINGLFETPGQKPPQIIYLPTEAGMPILEAGKR